MSKNVMLFISKVFLTILIICVFLIWHYQSNANEAEVFLIPDSFRGRVRVFFNEQCGQEPLYESGKRVFYIPANGVLFTKLKQEFGYIGKQHFFFIDSLGGRVSIKKMRSENIKEIGKRSQKEIGVFYSGRAGSGNYNDIGGYSFEEFFISSHLELNSNFEPQIQRQRDSVDHLLMLNCRSTLDK